MHRSPLEGSACRNAVASGGNRISVNELSDLGPNIVCRRQLKKLAVEPENIPPLCLAQPDDILYHRVEYRLKIEGGLADRLKHFRSRFLLFQRLVQSAFQ